MLKIAEITIETFYILSAMYIFMFKILKVSFSKKAVSNILRSVRILKSENGFCFSLLNRSIQDHLDHGASEDHRNRRILAESGFSGSFDREILD